LKLRAAKFYHGVEFTVYCSPKAGEVKYRMAFALARVTGIAGISHKNRPDTVFFGETPPELLIAFKVQGKLLAGKTIEGGIQNFIVFRGIGIQITGRHDEQHAGHKP